MRSVTAFQAAFLAIAASCSFALAADNKNDKKPEMQQAINFSHAGISLAVPVKFEQKPVSDCYGIMMAMLVERGEAKTCVLLSAFPAAKDETADTYANGMYKDLESNLGITKLDLLKKMTTKIAGIESTVQLIRYTFRGNETHSARVFFVREDADPAVRVCYMLEVQTPPGDKDLLVPTLKAVIGSVKMIPFARPCTLPVDTMIGPIYNYRGRYCMSVPCGWQVVRDDKGNIVRLAQSDYLGGEGVFAGVSVDKLASEETPESYAGKMLEAVQKAAEERGIVIEVVSESQAEMGGLKAQQLVVRKKVKATEKTPENLKLIVQRIICTPDMEDGLKPRAYIMHMEMPDTDPKVPLAVMDKLAAGFSLLDSEGMPIKPKTATTAPDATTKPADSQPAASQPADENKDAVKK